MEAVVCVWKVMPQKTIIRVLTRGKDGLNELLGPIQELMGGIWTAKQLSSVTNMNVPLDNFFQR